MPVAPIKILIDFAQNVTNLGISDELSFHEKKKTQLLNVAVGTGILLNIFFSLNNLLQGRPVLAFINLLLLIGGLAILYINKLHRFLLSRLIMTFLASILFTAGALLYRNGGEYFLIANLVIIIIYFNERLYLIAITLFNFLLFLGIKVFLAHYDQSFGSVPLARILFNMGWALLVIILALLFFKYEQLSYQQQVEEKNKELEKLNETKQKLLSIIAHDLRSPIAQLQGSLALVNREYLSPDEFRDISHKLAIQVNQLHGTLENLLRWSISQFQGIVATPERIGLPAFLEDKAVAFHRSALDAKKIHIRVEGDPHYVWADPEHLMLVFRNLIANAIKYSYEAGSIAIHTYQSGSRIITEITDNGTGMNAVTLASIFNPVSMLSSTGTSNEKGTGLGLKLCKEFIEINKGEIWALSTEGKGSSFFIALQPAP